MHEYIKLSIINIINHTIRLSCYRFSETILYYLEYQDVIFTFEF